MCFVSGRYAYTTGNETLSDSCSNHVNSPSNAIEEPWPPQKQKLKKPLFIGPGPVLRRRTRVGLRHTLVRDVPNVIFRFRDGSTRP